MWEDEGNDFGGQTTTSELGQDGIGSLSMGHSELMYGTFVDPALCGNGAWGGQFDFNHIQHQQPSGSSGLYQISTQPEDESAAAAEAAVVAAAAAADTKVEVEVDSLGGGEASHQQYYHQEQAASGPEASGQCVLSVPDLSSWWAPDSGRSAAATAGSWTVVGGQQQQHHQHQNPHQNQPLEAVSEREFIIVKKAKTNGGGSTSNGWDGGGAAASETAVVYECRICGRQCRWRSSISVHVRTHTGRKPYQCRVCHQRFADSSTRKKHEKKTHGCVIPGNKKAGGFEDQLAVVNASPLQQQQPQSHLAASLTCHLCFSMLPTEAELMKHLYEFHNHLVPEFSDSFGESTEDVPLLGPSRRVKQPEPEYQQQHQLLHQQQHLQQHQQQAQLSTTDGWSDRVLTEFDDHHHHQQLLQQQQGIPLPSGPQQSSGELDHTIGAVDHQHQQHQMHHRTHQQYGESRSFGGVGVGIGGVGGVGDSEGATDSLYPYEIGYAGRDLHGIESILDEGKLTSYNQHLEFDKLDW